MKQPLKILTSSCSSMHWWAIRHGVQMSQTSPVPALDECFLRWAFRIKGYQWLSRLRSPDGGDGQNPQGGEVTWGHEKWAKSYHHIFQKIVSPQPWASRNLKARIGVFELIFFWFILIWGPGCMGKWGHRFDLGLSNPENSNLHCHTLRFGSDTVETFKGLLVRVPTRFPITRTRRI